MSKFSTHLPIEEIHFNNKFYTIIYKSDKLNDNNFIFKYNEDLDISGFNDVRMNQIRFYAKYLNILKDKVVLKDINLNIIATFEIPYAKILAIRKYHSNLLTFSMIGFESYGYLIDINENKIAKECN